MWSFSPRMPVAWVKPLTCLTMSLETLTTEFSWPERTSSSSGFSTKVPGLEASSKKCLML